MSFFLSKRTLIHKLKEISPRYLPFADAATKDLPLSKLLRLSLFQFAVGMTTALIVGTLNRIMIIELGMAAWLVSLMVALPLVVAPFRAIIGFRSDTHRSFLGWRRVPFIWFGTMMQFSGLAIMPFALILLTGNTALQLGVGYTAAATAFLVTGAGLQIAQTAGLALATDLAMPETRPRVVALMYVSLLVGMVVCSNVFGLLLNNFSYTRLIQVVQGTAVCALLLNLIALWKQEARHQKPSAEISITSNFHQAWGIFRQSNRAIRFLAALGIGTAAFNMQDIILEPYGGQILQLPISQTTALTGLISVGALIAFLIAALQLKRGADPYRVAGTGLLVGIAAFSMVVFAEPLQSPTLFRYGVFSIGFGNGLFSVATLTAAMALESNGFNGLALGAWGAVQATSAGLAIFCGGAIRDVISNLALEGALGNALNNPAMGYSFVYHVEISLLFAALIALGPLVAQRYQSGSSTSPKFGLAKFPG
jgi:MFS transporter, BCD family, chlorophyll transporter